MTETVANFHQKALTAFTAHPLDPHTGRGWDFMDNLEKCPVARTMNEVGLVVGIFNVSFFYIYAWGEAAKHDRRVNPDFPGEALGGRLQQFFVRQFPEAPAKVGADETDFMIWLYELSPQVENPLWRFLLSGNRILVECVQSGRIVFQFAFTNRR